MRFLFFILSLASFTASANPDSSQFAAMAQELDYILTQIEEREQMGVQETTYVYMRPSYNTQLASTAKNKTPISEQAIKEADSYLYQLDTMGRKTIMFYTYMFYSEKENNKFDYKTTIEKTFYDLFAKRDGTGKVNVLINVMIYNQKLTDRADQYSFNLYQDKMRQSYELEDGLEKAVHAELSKEIKNKTANTMSKNCNKALVFRAKLLLEKVKGWKKSSLLTKKIISSLSFSEKLKKTLISHEAMVLYVYNDMKGQRSRFCTEHDGHDKIPEDSYRCNEDNHEGNTPNTKGKKGNPTIGVGHLIYGEIELQKWCDKEPITKLDAENLFGQDLEERGAKLLRNAIKKEQPNAKLNQCQFDALVSIVFNRGIGIEKSKKYPDGVGFRGSEVWKLYFKKGIYEGKNEKDTKELMNLLIYDGSDAIVIERRKKEAELFFECKYE